MSRRLLLGLGALGITVFGAGLVAGFVLAAAADDGDTDSAAAQEPDTATAAPASETDAWLGILGAPNMDPAGVEVVLVVPDSPADKAAIAPGDIITSIDGEPVADVSGLADAREGHRPGDEITLQVLKDGEGDETELKLTLGERPSLDLDIDLPDDFPNLPFLGDLGLEDLDHLLGGELRYLDDDGNVVTLSIDAGEVDSINDESLAIRLSDETEKSFGLTEDSPVPDGLEEGDRVFILSRDGEVLLVVGGGFPFLPGISLPELGDIDLPDFDFSDGAVDCPEDEPECVSPDVPNLNVPELQFDNIPFDCPDGESQCSLELPFGDCHAEGGEAECQFDFGDWLGNDAEGEDVPAD